MKTHRDFREIAGQSLLIFMLPAALLVLAGGYHYFSISKTKGEALRSDERLNVALGNKAITQDLTGVVSDVLYLSEHGQLQTLFPRSELAKTENIANEFVKFSRRKGLYDQIRLLDESGAEIVRINYNDGQPTVVPISELQDKSERYYFNAAWELSRGQVYMSPLDLNVERGEIEQPYKAVMRFATPVYDPAGNKRAVILLNYLGNKLLRGFRTSVSNIADHTVLLNSDGFWLSSAEPGREWGFMFGDEQTFSELHPDAWKSIRADGVGQISGAAGLFTFSTITPSSFINDQQQIFGVNIGDKSGQNFFWKIVSHVPPTRIAATATFAEHATPYILSMLILLAGSALLAVVRARHQDTQVEVEFEKRFRETLENVKLLAISMDRQGRINFCNEAFLGFTALSYDQVIGLNWIADFSPHEREPAAQELFHNLEADDAPLQYESEMEFERDRCHIVKWNISLMRDRNHTVTGVTFIGEDVTEARRVEGELRKLSSAVQQSPSIVMIVDKHGDIEYVNPKFTQLTGYTFEEVIGQNPRVLKSGETSSNEYDDLWETISAGREWHGVFQNRKKNGELYWEAASISAIRDGDGAITHYLAVKEDITERKRLEKEVEERNRELVKNQAWAAMGRMATMVAHDLRNPLSSVKMGLQILGKRAPKAATHDQDELKKIALEQVAYMEEILDDLLSFSRPDALKPEWVSIDKLLEKTIIASQRSIEHHHVRLISSYQPGLPMLNADPRKLRQAFTNLIVNAAHATDGVQTGEIGVTARLEIGSEQPFVRIEVADNGRGIDPTQCEKLFEPFFTTKAKGTGLGLAIVRRIIEQHLGTVHLESNENSGSRAVVLLPIGLAAGADLEAKRSSLDDASPSRLKASAT